MTNVSFTQVVCDTAKVRFFKQITTLLVLPILLICCLRYCKSTIFQANHNVLTHLLLNILLFAILQKYDFSSKSQHRGKFALGYVGCLRYCKSTIFQANHNLARCWNLFYAVVCDTAKVRFFKQITTWACAVCMSSCCLRYCKSTIFQANHNGKCVACLNAAVVCDTAKVRFFKQITTLTKVPLGSALLFAILQKYDFSSKSQPENPVSKLLSGCLRYCKSTIFQANHNPSNGRMSYCRVVCDTAKVRFFKQITTKCTLWSFLTSCLRYCKSTIFQANHNLLKRMMLTAIVVCDTAKVRFFKQITTVDLNYHDHIRLFAILQKYDFSSKSQLQVIRCKKAYVVCDTAKVRFFKQITTFDKSTPLETALFAILQKYDFSSKSQQLVVLYVPIHGCLRYCKSTIFQANHNGNTDDYVYTIVVCDTAKVRFFKQITTAMRVLYANVLLFAILQKYDFSSKSQHNSLTTYAQICCLRYCKSTIFQANHNQNASIQQPSLVVCDTAKVRFFKQITTIACLQNISNRCLRYCKSTIFQANHNFVQDG